MPAPAQPAGTVPAAGGLCRIHTGQEVPCLNIPDFPERAVKSVEGRAVVHHAPGTYSRDLPGLAYDFELAFTDNAVMWDWRVRDFEGCYDALRVYMGVPQEVGLQRLELRLADPRSFAEFVGAIHAGVWQAADIYDAPWVNPVEIQFQAYPDWDPAPRPHPDWAAVSYGCSRLPADSALCDIMPMWGNSHSIHLHAATTLAMANSVADLLSEDSLAEYNRYSDRVLQANAYLFPLWDNGLGDPTGPGPCADVWRAG